MTKPSPHNLRGNIFLPEHYQPSASDVICGRGTASFYHSGNQTFRKSIADNVEKYSATSDKRDKSMIVSAIANNFYFNSDKPCRFIRFCDSTKHWYEISYEQVRQKVGQTMREALVQQNPQRLSRKKHCRVLRSSTRRYIPTNVNSCFSQIVVTMSTHPKEPVVDSECEHVAVSADPHAACMQSRLSILSKWSPHYEAIPSSIDGLLNASSHGPSRCGAVSSANLEWAASIRKPLKAANEEDVLSDSAHCASDSDAQSMSSCHWFQDCDEISLSNSD